MLVFPSPEAHATQLSRNETFRRAVLAFSQAGGAVLAECGGLMYLGKHLHCAAAPEARPEASEGTSEGTGPSSSSSSFAFPMVGVFDWSTRMTPTMHMGYIEVSTRAGAPLFPPGATWRGQEYHFSELLGSDPSEGPPPFDVVLQHPGAEPEPAGHVKWNTLATYVHSHWGSCPGLAESFLRCATTTSPCRRVTSSLSLPPVPSSLSSQQTHQSQQAQQSMQLGPASGLPPLPEGLLGRKQPTVVSFVPTATDIALAIGAFDALAGVTSLCTIDLSPSPSASAEIPTGSKETGEAGQAGQTEQVRYAPEVICRSAFDTESLSSEDVEAAMQDLREGKETREEQSEAEVTKSKESEGSGLWRVDVEWLRRRRPTLAFVQNTCKSVTRGMFITLIGNRLYLPR